jgi:hypothetical protein
MSAKFTSKVFAWLTQINADCELPPNAAKVAIALAADYFNEDEGGMAWAALQTIADDACLAKSTVMSMIRHLQTRGHLRVEWGKPGSGHSNHYWMVLKNEPGDLFDQAEKRSRAADLSEPQKRSTCSPPKGRNRGDKRSTFEEKRSTALDLTLLDSRKTRGGSQTLSAVSASPDSEESLPREEKALMQDCINDRRPAEPEPEPELGDPFEAFWRAYPRKVAKDAARRAFAAAIKRGADPAILIAGAQRYAIERQGEPPRFTKHPATWLNGGCWEDEPIGAVTVDEDGNVVAIEEDEDEDPFEWWHAREREMGLVS